MQEEAIRVFDVLSGAEAYRKRAFYPGRYRGRNGQHDVTFIKQFYSSALYIPNQIVLQEDIDKQALLRVAQQQKSDKDIY